MKVLSLFDGISCAYVALQKAGIPIDSYTACEIDKHAIAISKKNHPTIQHKGSVKAYEDLAEMDLLIGGSPCQDMSIAKKNRRGLAGDRSGLFWEYVRIKDLCNPTWFILENVASMTDADRDTITEALGVDPIMIDASLVSAQSRKRYFWTNIPVAHPADRQIMLKDILEESVDDKYTCALPFTETNANAHRIGHVSNSTSQGCRVYSVAGKSVCLSANGGGLGAKTGLYKIGSTIRKLTPRECERLQGLPDDYTLGVSDTQRYKCCGNAFNADVIAHILKSVAE